MGVFRGKSSGKGKARKNMDGYYLGEDSMGRKAWLRDGDVKPAVDFVLDDLKDVMEDYNNTVNAATVAYRAKNMEDYRVLAEHSAKIYSSAKSLSLFGLGLEDERITLEQWAENYRDFRKRNGIGSEHKSTPINQRYLSSMYSVEDINDVHDTVQWIDSSHEFDEYLKEYEDNYRSAMEARRSGARFTSASDGENFDTSSRNFATDTEGSPHGSFDSENVIDAEPDEPSYEPEAETREFLRITEEDIERDRQRRAARGEPYYDKDGFLVDENGERVDSQERMDERTLSDRFFGEYFSGGATREDRRQARRRSKENEDNPNSEYVRRDLSQPPPGIANGRGKNLGFFHRGWNRLEESTGLDRYGHFRPTWRPRFGPFVFNFGKNFPLPSSVSLMAGRFKFIVWSRDFKPGFSSFDGPGPLSVRGKRKSKNKRMDKYDKTMKKKEKQREKASRMMD